MPSLWSVAKWQELGPLPCCPKKGSLWGLFKSQKDTLQQCPISPPSHDAPRVTVAPRPWLYVWECPASPSVPTTNTGPFMQLRLHKGLFNKCASEEGLLDSDELLLLLITQENPHKLRSLSCTKWTHTRYKKQESNTITFYFLICPPTISLVNKFTFPNSF